MRELVSYYRDVAAEYDKSSLSEERRQDVRFIEELCRKELSNKMILEVACGTGRWTQHLARFATFVVAIDINVEMLTIARRRNPTTANAAFVRADSYTLPIAKNALTGGFGGWWLSHVPKQALLGFLVNFHARLRPGSCVIFADDNRAVEEKVCYIDEHGNTYVRRVLSTGRVFQILKNFYTAAELREALKGVVTGIVYTEGNCHWSIRYTPCTLDPQGDYTTKA